MRESQSRQQEIILRHGGKGWSRRLPAKIPSNVRDKPGRLEHPQPFADSLQFPILRSPSHWKVPSPEAICQFVLFASLVSPLLLDYSEKIRFPVFTAWQPSVHPSIVMAIRVVAGQEWAGTLQALLAP